MMNSIFKKLNYKDQDTITVLNAPQEFSGPLREMKDVCEIETTTDNVPIQFLLVFEKMIQDIKLTASTCSSLLLGDCIVWYAYPKKTSKNYKSDITRDNGWQTLGDLGYEGVRMIAIDEDWTALRFRKTQYIKTLKRDPNWLLSKKK